MLLSAAKAKGIISISVGAALSSGSNAEKTTQNQRELIRLSSWRHLGPKLEILVTAETLKKEEH